MLPHPNFRGTIVGVVGRLRRCCVSVGYIARVPADEGEAAELMNTAGNYATSYAKALLAATRQSDLVKSDLPKRVGGLTPEQMARMEREMEAVQQDLKAVESRYGDDVLHLVIACGYVSKLVKNREIKRYLTHHHAEIQAELVAIISATSLDHSTEADHV